MFGESYKYVIVGGGLAGASAVSGIREVDKEGPILLVGNESVLPYDRPPLSKKLWVDKKRVLDVFTQDGEFYLQNGVDVGIGTQVTAIDPNSKTVTLNTDQTVRYEKLLLATGGLPRKLDIPGGDMWDVCYFRYLADYLRMRRGAVEGRSATVIGGGFIGSELAAAFNLNKVNVTLIFPDNYLVQRILPESFGRAVQSDYERRGVKILSGDAPVTFEKSAGKFVTTTKNGVRVESDILLVGIGITPMIDLAQQAGLQTGNGVIVNDRLQTSNPDIYAAGDIAFFPYLALGESRRVEHWDNALNQGSHAGRNMAGANQAYEYMPYFFSDLFDFGYEAVGDIDSRLEVFADWQKENDTGVLYYLKDGKVRGVMTCNIYGKMDDARNLIKSGKQVTQEDLRGAIG